MTYVKSPTFTRRVVNRIVAKLNPGGVDELSRRGKPTMVALAVEVPVANRAPVITGCRVASRAMDSFFTRMPDPVVHPVFQLTSTDAPPAGRAE